MSCIEIQQFLKLVTAWAELQPDICGLLLVGSYARGTPHPDSDIDLIFFTDDIAKWVSSRSWVEEFGETKKTVYEDWGGIKTLRTYFKSGLEVEFNFAKSEWSSMNPIDSGTKRVICDGAQVLYDPTLQLKKLLEAVKKG
jgi:hypothetical protein